MKQHPVYWVNEYVVRKACHRTFLSVVATASYT